MLLLWCVFLNVQLPVQLDSPPFLSSSVAGLILA